MNAKRAPEGELQNFVADVEELVTKLGDVKDAEVTRLRAKVRDTLDAARSSVPIRVVRGGCVPTRE
jgi:ElaB/YqjD/DUF883 family membrane-anchored ribosome-binding protein